MKKKRKTKKIVLLVLLLLVAVGIGAVVILGPQKQQEAISMLTSTKNQEAYRGTIRLTTEGSGMIEAANETAVTADHTVKVEKTVAEVGDLIAAGDVIARLDQDSIEDQIDMLESQLSEVNNAISAMDKSGSSTLTSPVTGRVKRFFAKED